jgi:hypothetical protein
MSVLSEAFSSHMSHVTGRLATGLVSGGSRGAGRGLEAEAGRGVIGARLRPRRKSRPKILWTDLGRHCVSGRGRRCTSRQGASADTEI